MLALSIGLSGGSGSRSGLHRYTWLRRQRFISSRAVRLLTTAVCVRHRAVPERTCAILSDLLSLPRGEKEQAGPGRGESLRDMIKLLMTWDLKNDLEQPYLEFVMREFVPGLMRLGVQPTEAWYTLYGDGPQILSGGVTDDLESMEEVLASDEWEELVSKLLKLVTNFQYKIIRANGRFQL